MNVDASHHAIVQVKRWPSEIPLRVTIFIVSILLWALVILGSLGAGLIYVILIALFLFFVQVGLIAYLRGTAVKLGPDQFPELHAKVIEYAARAGMNRAPDAYVMQADGSLNAFATKFFRGNFIVLYADLLDACGDDKEARDMIIGHEIGHLRCGHLNWWVVTAPGRIVPFLGSAYSRACEFTCDRWGATLNGSPEGARRGLAVLAAGGRLSRQVNLSAYVRQQDDLNTGWMTIARWLGGYPPLSQRISALSTDPTEPKVSFGRGRLRAWGIILAIVLTPFALFWAVPIAMERAGVDIERVFGNIEDALMLDGAGTPDASSGFDTFPAEGTGPQPGSFASVADMPAPMPAPDLTDTDHAGYAAQCFAGEMTACDDLYYSTAIGTPEEAYGRTCGGRVSENYDYECAELITP